MCQSLSCISLRLDRCLKAIGERTERAVIPGIFARRTGSIELDATDATDVVFGHVPAPGGYCVPLVDGDLHCRLVACVMAVRGVLMSIGS